LEFEKQKSQLNIQLKFSRNQLEKKLNKVNALKEDIQKRREDIDNLKKAAENCWQILDELMAKKQQLKDIFITQNSNIDTVQTQIEEERKKFLAVERQVGKLQKEVVLIQTSVQKKRLEKHDMLLDCKVQNIEIILLLGSLDVITEVE
ncbi:PREDICTED: structural maintenance of chromosomes protein 1B-like, partial [Galeopterus variegatus]|uniref:Structural maintenance of chromosomes protein 1B-like n=1 Tax=Galeopterus variegatus TaxID=482537 RepID=A0ABM0Q1M5_GALVR